MSACGLHSFPSLLLKITFSCYFHFECSLVKRLLYYVFTTSVVSRSTYARCCIYCITVQPNTGCKLNSYHDVSNQRTLHNIPVCFVARTVSLLVYTGQVLGSTHSVITRHSVWLVIGSTNVYFCVHVCYTRHLLYAVLVFLILPSRASRGRSCMTCRYLADLPLRSFCGLLRSHWRQRRRGCRGHIPPIFCLGGRQREYPPQYFYVLSDIADQYWLPSVRSALSRFHSAIRRHQFASVRQADSRLTRLVPPPTLNLRWRHCSFP